MTIQGRWTDEKVERLKFLWAEGYSASLIAQDLWDKFDANFSRNAVLGKAFRLGLSERITLTAKAIKRPEKRPRPQPKRIQRRLEVAIAEVADPLADAAIPFAQRLTIYELTAHTCRWPVGEPQSREFFFCGAVVAPDRPYCPGHCARAYEKPTRPEKRRPAVYIPRAA